MATVYRFGSESGLSPCSKGTEKWERPRGRCQEEKKEEGIVKTNKSEAESVASWCYQRPGGMQSRCTPARSLELDLHRVRGVPGEVRKCRKIRHTRGSQERSIQISKSTLHG